MLRLLRILLGFGVAGVSLLQHPRACWAAETTQPGVMATAFGGAGEMVDFNNESTPDVFDVTRAGLGVAGVLRLKGRDHQSPAVSRHLWAGSGSPARPRSSNGRSRPGAAFSAQAAIAIRSSES